MFFLGQLRARLARAHVGTDDMYSRRVSVTASATEDYLYIPTTRSLTLHMRHLTKKSSVMSNWSEASDRDPNDAMLEPPRDTSQHDTGTRAASIKAHSC